MSSRTSSIVGGSTFDLAGTHGPSGVSGDTGNPKDRINARLSWTKGPGYHHSQHQFRLAFQHHRSVLRHPGLRLGDRVRRKLPGWGDGAESAILQRGILPRDGYLWVYQLTTNFQLHASVTNLFNKQPPVDVQTYGSGSIFLPYDAALHQDGAVGRYMMVGFDYDF